MLPRGVRATALAGGLTLALAACGSVVSATDVEAQIAMNVRVNAGVDADTVHCPENLPVRVGAAIVCDVTVRGSGARVRAEITAVGDDGRVSYVITAAE